MAPLNEIAGRQMRRLAIIAHHQIAGFVEQRLGDRHQRQRALADQCGQGGLPGAGGEVDHPGNPLLLKGEQAALKMLTVVQRLAEKDHIPLLFQLLDDACHYLNGKAVAEIAQDQADQVGGVGAKIGGGHVMHVAQGGDGGVDFFDRRL